MNCTKIAEKLGFYIDGTLDERSLREVEAHLDVCADCRTELAALRLIISSAREIEEIEPPVDLRSRIAAATTGRSLSSEPRVPVFARLIRALAPPAVRWAAGTAAVAAVVCIAVSLRPAPQPGSRVTAQRSKPPMASVEQRTAPQPVTKIAVAPESLPAAEVRRYRRTDRPQTIVKATASAPTKAKLPPAVSVSDTTDNAASTDLTDNVETDTTTSTVTVSAKDLAAAGTSPAEAPVKTISKASEKLASHPLTNQEQVQKWVEEAKAEASMHRRDRGPAGLKLISTKF